MNPESQIFNIDNLKKAEDYSEFEIGQKLFSFIKTENYYTALFYALNESLNQFDEFISKEKYDIKSIESIINSKKFTELQINLALCNAVKYNHTKVAALLIANGAKPNIALLGGEFRLIHIAVLHQNPIMIELLLSCGDSINAKTALGSSLLYLAQFNGLKYLEKFLENQGAKNDKNISKNRNIDYSELNKEFEHNLFSDDINVRINTNFLGLFSENKDIKENCLKFITACILENNEWSQALIFAINKYNNNVLDFNYKPQNQNNFSARKSLDKIDLSKIILTGHNKVDDIILSNLKEEYQKELEINEGRY